MTAARTPEKAASTAVLDTNVVLDWLVFRDPRVAPLAAALETGTVRLLATAHMRAEFADVLTRSHLDRWAPDRERSLAQFDRLAVACAEPQPSRLNCTDADDQVFIDLAIEHRCRWLVTHDRALLKLAGRARLHGLLVLPPARWSAA